MTDCDDIIQLEAVLYERLEPGRRQMKVAMLLAMTFGGKTLPSSDIVNAALERLAQRTDIETFGDIRTWRRSEIRRRTPK
ncbi:hypothetical protein [Roseibium sp.]|uniref:hypothetical protein n=1 Tax=Roseibium sp. TaxID=1936156 RepID=UPI003BA9F525